MNALLTCVVGNRNVKMAQDRIDDHARCRCLMGTMMAGSIAINPFYIVLRGGHLEIFAFGFLHSAEAFLDLLCPLAGNIVRQAQGHES